MTRSRRLQPAEGRAITWDLFKVAVRNVDLNSLILEAAAVTTIFANGRAREEWKALVTTPWTIAEVARTAIAWGGPGGQHTDRDVPIPTGVLSIGELERLLLLNAEELGGALLTAGRDSLDNVMLLNPAFDQTNKRGNPLLTQTWSQSGCSRASVRPRGD